MTREQARRRHTVRLIINMYKSSEKKGERDEFDVHNLEDKILGEDIVKFTNLSKVYKLPGKGDN